MFFRPKVDKTDQMTVDRDDRSRSIPSGVFFRPNVDCVDQLSVDRFAWSLRQRVDFVDNLTVDHVD